MPFVFRGYRAHIRQFPSGVFLMQHSDGRRILFDTGYNRQLRKTGLKGLVYRFFNPTRISADEEIASQLTHDGVNPKTIDYVILSHLHPDHIGGISSFTGSTFIISEPMQQALRHPRLSDLLFLQFIPDWFSSKTSVLSESDFKASPNFPFKTHDLLQDGSILVCQLPGHTRGHNGVLINGTILLAGDAAWGTDLLPITNLMSPLARRVHDDFDTYIKTTASLQKLQASGISIYCSHDVIDRKELVR